MKLFTALTWLLTATTALAERPNIVVILCDDLGYSDVGFNGATDIRTPSLDRLAASGTVCTSAYVCHPFCGPSRMGLLTGRYPHKLGAPFNLPGSEQGIEEYNRKGVDTQEVLISKVLQDADYYTGAIGKWHMGIDPQYHPNNRGFDEYYGFLGGGHKYFPAEYRPLYQQQLAQGNKAIWDYLTPLEHNGVEVEETEYITDALSREAVRFIRQAATSPRPFFLYVAYNAPHVPLEAKAEDMAEFPEIANDDRRTYAGMVYAVDRGVGRIADALAATGELDNTLLVFLSDNGGQLRSGATNHPLRGGKGDTFEGGFRVPMLFHWPGRVPADAKFSHPISTLDFYPTFVRLAEAALPAGKRLDGREIWDAFQAGKDPHQGDQIYAARHRNGFTDFAAREGRWKICRSYNGPWQLFDIEQDVGEERDLSLQHPERLQTMISQVKAWTDSHTEPEWFHDRAARDTWRETDMPNFDKDLGLREAR